MNAMKKTPLFEQHLASGAKLVPFAGWQMPVSFGGIIEEHKAVRENVGMFDVSHMGRFRLSGDNAARVLDYVTVGRASALKDGQWMYTMMLTEGGGVIDDILVGRESEDVFPVVVNAANSERDYGHMEEAAAKIGGCRLDDVTEKYALVAVQGPRAREVVRRLLEGDDAGKLSKLEYYRMDEFKLYGNLTMISRTGYTGELGYEIFIRADDAEELWKALEEEGVTPCGLGARDTLRLEAGYPLYGHELDEDHTPLEAGQSWTVDFEKDDFIGKQALVDQKREGIKQRLRGVVTESAKKIPRPGYALRHNNKAVAHLVSGGPAPTLNAGIGTAFLPVDLAETGTELEMELRKNTVPVKVVKPQFYRDGTVRD